MGKYIENVSSRSFLLCGLQFFGGYGSPGEHFDSSINTSSADWMFFLFWVGYSTTAPQASMQVSDILFFALVFNPGVWDLDWSCSLIYLRLLLSPRWCGRCIRRPWSTPGPQKDAEGRAIVEWHCSRWRLGGGIFKYNNLSFYLRQQSEVRIYADTG